MVERLLDETGAVLHVEPLRVQHEVVEERIAEVDAIQEADSRGAVAIGPTHVP